MNPITLIDGYKLDHRRQYPADTRRVYSNWTPRSSRVAGQDQVVFFGLQAFIDEYLVERLEREFFRMSEGEVCEKYVSRVNSYLGPNQIGCEHIRALHKLGHLPLEIRALPEGTLCPLRVPMLTVENTHDDFAWLVNYYETLISSVLWMPCTSATTAYRLRLLLNDAAKRTGGDPAFVPWQGHDFSMRGMAGPEAACLSGAGHLLSFTGTDTIPAIEFIEQHYPGNNGLIGASVAATEHSVMSAGGERTEEDTFGHILDLYPGGIISIVSDTWDLWNVVTRILPSIKKRIVSRDGKVVIRPDSGDPVKIVCGDVAKEGPARKGVVEILWDTFGGTTTATGHKQLDPHIGVIYGDAITYDRAKAICDGLAAKGFASTNMVFGVGSYSYQYVTRDTYGFAMKATWANVGGTGRDLFKKPATDDGTKFSATGRLAVTNGDGRLRVIERASRAEEAASMLRPVWRDGEFVRRSSFAEIRRRLWAS
jgi:nicotinamide phosphoribosyltransferase